jgi:hypothetical protein
LFVTNDENASATRSYSNNPASDEDSITATQGTNLAVVTYWTACGGECGADEDHESFFHAIVDALNTWSNETLPDVFDVSTPTLDRDADTIGALVCRVTIADDLDISNTTDVLVELNLNNSGYIANFNLVLYAPPDNTSTVRCAPEGEDFERYPVFEATTDGQSFKCQVSASRDGVAHAVLLDSFEYTFASYSPNAASQLRTIAALHVAGSADCDGTNLVCLDEDGLVLDAYAGTALAEVFEIEFSSNPGRSWQGAVHDS